MVILGLGSNMGNRQANLQAAVDALKPTLSGLRCSSVLESGALLLPGAPEEWDIPFLNMAVCGQARLSAELLLEEVKRIERCLGRIDRGRWGPREIDIDILAYGDQVQQKPHLKIPHPELLNRDFALLPLAELAPKWSWPVAGEFYGMTARDIAEKQHFALGSQLYLAGVDVHA